MALLLGVVFALLTMEAALRTGGVLYRVAQERRNRISISREGYRIMCLGESTTAGGKGSWPALLERVLAERYPAARFSVINKGISGVNTSAIMKELEKNLDEVRPDMVIAMMGMNDGFIRYYEGITGVESPLFKYFRLYKLFRILLNNDKISQPLPVPDPVRDEHCSGPADPYTPFQDGTIDMAGYEPLLRKKLEQNPEDATSLYVLGRYLVFSVGWKDHSADVVEKGEKMLLRAMRLEPKNSFVRWTLGMNYLLVKSDPQHGLPMLEKAAELNPSADNWYCLGRTYKDYGMPEKAETALLRAIVPGTPLGIREEATFELCWLYISRRKFSKAEELLQKARARDPYNEKIFGALAGLYSESGRPDLARMYTARLTATRWMFTDKTRASFRELRQALKSRGVRLAIMQYPMCDLEPLMKLFDDPVDIIFIDNERTFRKAVKEKGYTYYFQDMFAGNFGHCTGPGNALIARDAAAALSAYLGRVTGK